MDSPELFPLLTTDRLVLRQLTRNDAPEIYFLRSDERVLKYLSITKANSIEDALAFIDKINDGIANNGWKYWAITLKNNDTLIGTICFWNLVPREQKAEIGYTLHPDYERRGIMQEAFTEVMDYGFQIMKLKTVVAELHPDNSRSMALLTRNGFTYTTRAGDAVVYSLSLFR